MTLVSGAAGTASDRSSGADGRTPSYHRLPGAARNSPPEPVFPSTVRRLSVILLTLTLALTLAQGASAAATKSIWGPVVLPNGQPAGPVYKSLGVDDLQLALSWDTIAPTQPASERNPADPAYNWPPVVDQAIAAGRQYGFTVSIVLLHSPPWANAGRVPTYVPNSRQFGDFAFAASKRYPGVRRWMIWGEPSRGVQFQPMVRNSPVAPRLYARLVDSAYGALKQADRKDTVIGGMSFTAGDVTPKDWIRWMRLPNGKPPRLDMYGHNAFSTRIPRLRDKPFTNGNYDFSDLDTMETQLHKTYARAYPSKFRKRGPRIWISEFTIQAGHGSQDFNFFVSRANQGRWIAAAFREANRTDYIAGVGWLGLLDEPLAPFNRTTGLLTYELKKKPSYFAYQRAK